MKVGLKFRSNKVFILDYYLKIISKLIYESANIKRVGTEKDLFYHVIFFKVYGVKCYVFDKTRRV